MSKPLQSGKAGGSALEQQSQGAAPIDDIREKGHDIDSEVLERSQVDRKRALVTLPRFLAPELDEFASEQAVEPFLNAGRPLCLRQTAAKDRASVCPLLQAPIRVGFAKETPGAPCPVEGAVSIGREVGVKRSHVATAFVAQRKVLRKQLPCSGPAS
ncbi:hypothetical protein D3C87_1484380 [compost metagenome]